MNATHSALANTLSQKLIEFDGSVLPLPGIFRQNCDSTRLDTLARQLVDSCRRVDYVAKLRVRSTKLGRNCSDPTHPSFDPLKAAIRFQMEGLIDEAYWMIFLFVHFGKHPRSGWHYVRTIYGRYDLENCWNWTRTSDNVCGFRDWLDAHQNDLKYRYHSHGFGNHRKRESLDAYSPSGTGAVVQSYVNWIGPPRTHRQFVDRFIEKANGDPAQAFDSLYHSMNCVCRFGRLARFDYLCMVGKIGLATIVPGVVYLKGATGPLRGARLLLGTRFTIEELEEKLCELGGALNLGMQVLEDALCNWQKSPTVYRRFRD